MCFKYLKMLNRKELERIQCYLEDQKEPGEKFSINGKIKATLNRMCRPEFLKPFLFLCLIRNFGLQWAGFPALAFYMHTILKQIEVPLDEYWVAVALAGFRSLMTVALSFVLYKVRDCLTCHSIVLNSSILYSFFKSLYTISSLCLNLLNNP